MPEGLFPTPSGVRQQLADERLGRANMIGQLGPGGHGALAGLLTGNAIGGLLGAPQDPRLAKAAKFQQVEQEMSQLGLEPGTKEFTQQIYQRMLPVGQSEALQAYQMALEMEGQRTELDQLTAGDPEPANIYRALQAVGYPPELATVLAQVPEVGKDVLKKRLSPEQATVMYRDAVEAAGGNVQAAQKIMLDIMQARGRPPPPPVQVNVGDAYKPQTQPAKLAADLQYLQGLPPGPERDEAITAIRRAQKAQGVGAEAQRSSNRMQAVDSLSQNFITAAQENPGDVGPAAGLLTRGKVERGFGSRTEAELTSMEAQMRALLGTALSGAAIPASEWPTYQAQIPAATDNIETMKGKAKTFRKMMSILEDIKDGKKPPEAIQEVPRGTTQLSDKARGYFGSQ